MAVLTREGKIFLLILGIVVALWSFNKLYNVGVIAGEAQNEPIHTARGLERGKELAETTFQEKMLHVSQTFALEKIALTDAYEAKLAIKKKALRLKDIEIKNLKIRYQAEIDRQKQAVQSVLMFKCPDLDIQKIKCGKG